MSGLGSAFTRPINVTGQPAISLPLGWPDDGLPRGVQLVADYGREDLLDPCRQRPRVGSHRGPTGVRRRLAAAFVHGERSDVP